MPSLASSAASTTEPEVGASEYASGDQVWNGKIGAFTTKAAVNAQSSSTPVVPLRWVSESAVIENVSAPPAWDWCRNPTTRIPTNRNAEPTSV